MDGMTEWNKACLPCRLVHATCNGERPCKRCSALGRPDNCVNVERKKRGRPRKNPIEGEELLEKRARLNEGNEHSGAASLGMADSSASHNMATTYHMSFPSVSVQQPAPRGSFYPPSSSPSDSPHSSPSSSSSSSSGEHQQSEAMLARPQRHHHHQHHQYHHSGSSSSRHHHHHHKRSRDRHEEEHSTDVGLLINEMRELRKENKMLNEKLATFCEKVDRRLTSSECKIDSLSQSLTTTTSTGSFNMAGSTPSGWSSTATFSASPLFIRKEVLKDLPFLLDYDIISEQVPFLIDDLRKPFIVRRIFDPTPEEDLTVPVTTYANPACCALLGTVLHELVGAPCWFALEQPIRAYLTARSDKPVGDIFLNAVTRKGNRKRLLRLFSRNQVFYNAKGNAKWWISIIDKTEELTASGQQDSNKIALILNRNRRGGATISLLPKDGESDDEDATPSTTQTSPSSSGSSPAVSTPSTSSSSSSSSYASSSSAPLTSVVTTISSLPASSALSTSRSLAPASSFSTAANFFVPATTYASPFISTSSLAPVSSPSISSFLYSAGLPGAISAPALRSEGAVGELSDFASSIAGGGMNPRVSQGGDKPEYLDPELQELWALLAPTDFSGQPSAALSTCK